VFHPVQFRTGFRLSLFRLADLPVFRGAEVGGTGQCRLLIVPPFLGSVPIRAVLWLLLVGLGGDIC